MEILKAVKIFCPFLEIIEKILSKIEKLKDLLRIFHIKKSTPHVKKFFLNFKINKYHLRISGNNR